MTLFWLILDPLPLSHVSFCDIGPYTTTRVMCHFNFPINNVIKTFENWPKCKFRAQNFLKNVTWHSGKPPPSPMCHLVTLSRTIWMAPKFDLTYRFNCNFENAWRKSDMETQLKWQQQQKIVIRENSVELFPYTFFLWRAANFSKNF